MNSFQGVVMKWNIFIALFLIMIIFLFPIQTSGKQITKINTLFLKEMKQESKLVPIMVELNENPVVTFSKNIFEQRSQYQNLKFEYGSNGEDLYRSKLLSMHDSFVQKLLKNGISLTFRYNCTDALNSVALNVKGSDIQRLVLYPEIRKVYDDRNDFKIFRDIAAITTGASRIWSGISSKGSATGKGVVVGVIDSGIDKVHMDKGEFAKRVVGGYNVADHTGDYIDSVEGHGTHVAGIVGGKGTLDSQKGMAYEVKYRIYKCQPKKYPGAIANPGEAIEKSVQEKCNVINMSFGREGPSPSNNDDYYGDMISNAVQAGTFAVAAAGNSGSRGRKQEYPMGPPATVEDSLTVAATNDRQQIVHLTITINSAIKTVVATSFSGTARFDNSLNNKDLVDCGFGGKNEFEKDVTGKIAFIQRGPVEDKEKGIKPLTFKEKMDNAMKNGAIAVLLYNNSDGSPSGTVFKDGDDTSDIKTIPIAMMPLEDGLWIKSILNESYKTAFEATNNNVIADFSSEGPTIDGFFKPEISAPGTNILSTILKGKYAAYSGTSMACPVVTGLVALIKQANPGWSGKQIKSALMNTAEIMINPYNNLPLTFQLQGAGEARVDRAINTPAFIEPQALLIQKEKIEPGRLNPSDKVVFSVTSNSSSETNLKLDYSIFGFSDEKFPITLSFDVNNLSVQPKKQVNFSVRFTIEWNAFKRSRYEGIIKVGDQLHIPFILYRNSVNKIPDTISDIKISPSELEFTKEGPNPELQINFSLNTGRELKYEYFQGGTDYENYAPVSVVIVDNMGEIMSKIPCSSTYLVGNYELHWDGKSSDGKYILPKGKFYVQFKVMGYDYDKREEFTVFTSSKDSKTLFNVKESFVPSPTPAILSTYKVFTVNSIFQLNLIIPEVTNCAGVEFELMYDANKLFFKKFKDGGFLSSDAASVTSKFEDDGQKGILTISLMRDDKTGLSGKNALMVQITFKAIEVGKLKFSFRSSRILFADDTAGKIKVSSPDSRISKKTDYLLADVNNDKIVDQFDWKIFLDSYPSMEKDTNFESNCDFNQDRIVNFDDLLVIAKEYGNSL